MKRKIRSMICCLFTAALLVSFSLPTFAATNGKVTFNSAGIMRFGKVEVEPGTSIPAKNGQSVPAVITYTDAAGGKTNYLSVSQLSSLLDVPVSWNAQKNCVSLGKDASGSVYQGEEANAPVSPQNVYHAEPVIGMRVGKFTEVAPSVIDDTWALGGVPVRMIAKCENGLLAYRIENYPGHIAVVSVTNQGSAPQNMRIYRMPAVNNGTDQEYFPSMQLAQGQTVTRAFQLDEDADALQKFLYMDITGAGTNVSDVKIEILVYGPNTEESVGVTATDNNLVSKIW